MDEIGRILSGGDDDATRALNDEISPWKKKVQDILNWLKNKIMGLWKWLTEKIREIVNVVIEKVKQGVYYALQAFELDVSVNVNTTVKLL